MSGVTCRELGRFLQDAFKSARFDGGCLYCRTITFSRVSCGGLPWLGVAGSVTFDCNVNNNQFVF